MIFMVNQEDLPFLTKRRTEIIKKIIVSIFESTFQVFHRHHKKNHTYWYCKSEEFTFETHFLVYRYRDCLIQEKGWLSLARFTWKSKWPNVYTTIFSSNQNKDIFLMKIEVRKENNADLYTLNFNINKPLSGQWAMLVEHTLLSYCHIVCKLRAEERKKQRMEFFLNILYRYWKKNCIVEFLPA